MSQVRDAARWLRVELDGKGWVPSELLRRRGAAAGHPPAALVRARVRAGVAYRRIGFGPDQRSEWKLTEPANRFYKHDPRRKIDPPPFSRTEVSALCDTCGRLASMPAHVAEMCPSCVVPACDGSYVDGTVRSPDRAVTIVTTFETTR